jgi:hypothetical protein
MNGKEQLLAKLGALAESGEMPRSQCGIRFMSVIRPLILSGVVAEKRSGGGRQIIVQDSQALQSFIQQTFPIVDSTVSLPSRVVGVHRFRDTKTYRSDTPDIVRIRAFRSGILRKSGRPVEVDNATATHGVFSFRLKSDYTLHGQVALVENPTMFDHFERLKLAVQLVIYGQGRVSTRVVDWLANQHDNDFSLLHFPDYDPIGLAEFERIRKRLASRAQIYLPENLDDLFCRLGNRNLLQKPRSQRLLAELRKSNIREVQTVVKLIDSHNAGLEQEALIG